MPKKAQHKRELREISVRQVQPQARPFLVWDEKQRGLALQVRPNGTKVWKAIYTFGGRTRWYHLARADEIGIEQARELAMEVMYHKAKGRDLQAEKRAQRSVGTFADLATRYLEEYAKRKNKSWEQADKLVTKHLLPRLGSLQSSAITHDDAERAVAAIKAPIVANQVAIAGSAIYSWALKKRIDGLTSNPFRHIERSKPNSRERVLSDSELPRFWQAFGERGRAGTALKLILLTGQRPGEVTHMRWEHLDGGWWTLPGKPVPALGWNGTKNGESHRVWIPQAAREFLYNATTKGGYVLGDARGRPVGELPKVMRSICAELGIDDKVTPHDLRRSHGTRITGLGFGREAMNRIQNHVEGGIADVYDRHDYGERNMQIMEAVAALARDRGRERGRLRPDRDDVD